MLDGLYFLRDTICIRIFYFCITNRLQNSVPYGRRHEACCDLYIDWTVLLFFPLQSLNASVFSTVTVHNRYCSKRGIFFRLPLYSSCYLNLNWHLSQMEKIEKRNYWLDVDNFLESLSSDFLRFCRIGHSTVQYCTFDIACKHAATDVIITLGPECDTQPQCSIFEQR